MHTLLSRLAAATALAMIAGSAGAVEAPKSIRIGYAISLSGVNAQAPLPRPCRVMSCG